MARARTAILLITCLALADAPIPLAAASCGARAADFTTCVRTQCKGLQSRALHACRRSCRPARIRTLAYVVTDCRQSDPSSITGRIRLFVKRGDCEPVVVPGPEERVVPDPIGNACRRFLGEARFGPNEVVGGIIERLGVSIDGARVVFEVTDDFSTVAGLLTPEQEGFFVVRADGTDLRKLGPPSRSPSWRVALDPRFPFGGVVARFDDHIPFSPDGRTIAFADIGPGATGVEATQVFILDLASGQRTQVTHLERVPLAALDLAVAYLSFLDDRTLLFFSSTDSDGSDPAGGLRPFTVRTDGTALRAL